LRSSRLRIGQRLVLVIPPRVTTQPAPGKNVHVVRRGETLFSIAKKYGTSVSEIRIINSLRTTRIAIGQRLRIR
jgi:LysM repeat protein